MSKIDVWQYQLRSARLRGEQYKILFLSSFSLSLPLKPSVLILSLSISITLSHTISLSLLLSHSISLSVHLSISLTPSLHLFLRATLCYAVLYVTWRWSLQNARHPCLPPPQGRSQQPLGRTYIKKIIMRRWVENWVKWKRKESHKAGSRWIL